RWCLQQFDCAVGWLHPGRRGGDRSWCRDFRLTLGCRRVRSSGLLGSLRPVPAAPAPRGPVFACGLVRRILASYVRGTRFTALRIFRNLGCLSTVGTFAPSPAAAAAFALAP